MFVCLFVRLLLISFSLTSFRFHYLFGVIPLALVPCGMFWGVEEGRARWSTGRGSTGRGGGTGGEGPGEGKLDRCIMHQVHTSYHDIWGFYISNVYSFIFHSF
jgi:hypothetical protein